MVISMAVSRVVVTVLELAEAEVADAATSATGAEREQPASIRISKSENSVFDMNRDGYSLMGYHLYDTWFWKLYPSICDP